MKTREIHYRIKVSASPEQVYQVLTDPELHEKVTGVGINYRNHEQPSLSDWKSRFVIPLRMAHDRIVHAETHMEYPEGYYTIIELGLKAARNDKTRIDFHHYGVPSRLYRKFDEWWYTNYWQPIKKYFVRK